MRDVTDRALLPQFEGLESRQLLSAGQLDPTFGDGGKVITNLGLGGANGVAVQADGRIVASAFSDDRTHVNLVRYNADGSVDTSFGTGGVVTADFGVLTPDGAHFSDVDSMVAQPDGKLVIGGRYTAGHVYGQLVARFNADGTLDTSFGTGGAILMPGFDETANPSFYGSAWTAGRAIVTSQADGAVLVAVVRGDLMTDDLDLTVYRYTSAGVLDASFGGGDGIASVDVNGEVEVPVDIAMQADGKIVIAADGYTIDHTGGRYEGIALKTHVIRLNAYGSLDTSFGSGGVVTENTASEQIRAGKVAIGLDGKILLLGENDSFHTPTSGTDDKFLIRYDTDGTRDASFGAGGKLTLTTGYADVYNSIMVQPDGKLLLAGNQAGGAGTNGKSAMFSQRRNVDGSLDASYGTGDTTRVEFGPSFDSGGPSALQQDGSIIVVGFTAKDVTGETRDSNDVAIARFQGDAGSAGSKHASLRRGIDQQSAWTGRPAGKHHHRSPKRRAHDEAVAAAAAAAKGKRHHRSPKRRAHDEAVAAAAAAAGLEGPAPVGVWTAAFNVSKRISEQDGVWVSA